MGTLKTDWRGYFDVSSIPLETLVSKAFDLSRPQGMGFLHHQPGGLTASELSHIIDGPDSSPHYAVSLDYVRGRSLKFDVRQNGLTRYVRWSWYDHGNSEELMRQCGVSEAEIIRVREEYEARRAQEDADYEAEKNLHRIAAAGDDS